MRKVLITISFLIALKSVNAQVPFDSLQVKRSLQNGTPCLDSKENVSIRLRCGSSLQNTNQPLFIIDGMPAESKELRQLDPKDIKSITVLKDAAALALYGSRAASGVVLIETKQMDVSIHITDQTTGLPVPNATIMVIQRNRIRDTFNFITNGEGFVFAKQLGNKKNVELIISSIGYQTKKMIVDLNDQPVLQCKLEQDYKNCSPVVVTAINPVRSWCGGCYVKSIRTYWYNDAKPLKNESVFAVFPNPSRAGSTVTIFLADKIDDFALELYTTAGQQLVRQEYKQNTTQSHVFQLPVVSSGIYIITLLDKTSKKLFTQKLIIP